MAARQKKASTPTHSPAFNPAGKLVSVFGESPLAEEFATRCVARGFSVHMRINPGSAGATKALLPKGTRLVTRPDPKTYVAIEVTNISSEAKRKNLADLDKALRPATPILSSSVTMLMAEQVSWVARPRRVIGIGALPSLLDGGLMEFAPSALTDEETLASAKEFAAALEKEPAVVQDSVGLVLPRILCMLANEACFARMEGVSSGEDIDTAMRLGTNYPRGPMEWAERIGARQVLAVVAALHASYGEDRYRPAPFLRKAAFYGSFLQ